MIDAHACNNLSIYQQLVVDSDSNSPWPIPVNRNEDFRPLTDEQRRITAPFVFGIDLQTREWGKPRHGKNHSRCNGGGKADTDAGYFFVSCLEDIKWDENAFDNLLISPEYSQQVLNVALGVLRDPHHALGCEGRSLAVVNTLY